MNTYTPVFEYPRTNQTDLSEEDRESLDINERIPAANFIRDAIEEVLKTRHEGLDRELNRDDVPRIGLIIENMLDENFGENVDGLAYREFVMAYVLKRFSNAWLRHRRIVKGLMTLGLIDLR